jgi:cytochrome c biogenesis protein CcmG/thiol:disulfide interchange protein DsbE
MLGTLEVVLYTTKLKLFPFLALAAAMTLASCSKMNSERLTSRVSNDRKLAPEFTLQDANGAAVKLADYRGKVVLLNFWATWCGPCQVEIPWFEEFEQQFKSKGFEVVGVSMDEDGWTAIKPFVEQHKVNYRILLGTDSVGQLYGGVDSLPTTFIIDRDGKFAFSPHVGLAGKDEYRNEIESLLGSKQTTTNARSVGALPALLLPAHPLSGAAK